jgi:hypothetical protein
MAGRVLVVNAFDPRNLGDAAIFEGLVWTLRQHEVTHIAVAASVIC